MSPAEDAPRNTVVLCVDLMDRSRIAAALPDAVFVRSPAALVDRVAADGAPAVIVDLSRPGAIEAIVSVVATGATVTGYGSHVDTELLDAARAAGCNEVLPRSRFFARLDRARSAAPPTDVPPTDGEAS